MATVKTTANVIINNPGMWPLIMKEVKEFERLIVKVGILEGERRKDGIVMAMIAAVHEYGADIENAWGKGIKVHVPERSFIRSWVLEHENQINTYIMKLYGQVLDGKLSARQALKKLGAFGERGIKQQINSITTPPLKYREGHPLIDTNQLRGGVHSQVVSKASIK